MLTGDTLKRFHELEKRIESLERELTYVRQELNRKQDNTKFGPGFTPGTLPGNPVIWPKSVRLGCRVCGLGSDGAMGYACPRSDCPTAVRCVGDMK